MSMPHAFFSDQFARHEPIGVPYGSPNGFPILIWENSDGNPLDDLPRHFFLPPVVKPLRRSRLRVPGQVFVVLKREP